MILSCGDNSRRLDREKLVVPAGFLCLETGTPEIWLHNKDEDRVTVIRQVGRGGEEHGASSRR